MMMSALITGEQCKASSRRRAPPQIVLDAADAGRR
jgi:hypothetical protein